MTTYFGSKEDIMILFDCYMELFTLMLCLRPPYPSNPHWPYAESEMLVCGLFMFANLVVCLLLFTCSYVVSVRRDFLFLWVRGIGCVILLWHSLRLPYNYLACHACCGCDVWIKPAEGP